MELFSRRHKLGRPSVGLLYDTVPQGVHRALINLLSSRISRGDDSGWMSVQKATFRTPQVRQDFEYNSSPSLALLTVSPIVERCEWYTLLDICELLAALFSTQSWEESRPSLTYALFEEAVNEIFADNCLGYELSGGRVEKLGAPYVDDVVTEVRQVLQNAEYAGPNDQFEKAIAAVNNLTVEELRERLDYFEMVYTLCNCGKDDCFGWKIVDQAVVAAAEAQHKGRMAAMRNEQIVGGLR